MLRDEEMRGIMKEYGTYLTQLSFMYVKNWQAAEDIVQEAFITYFKNYKSFEQRSTLKTYLSKIVINKSIDYLRSVKSKARTLLQLFQGVSDESVRGTDELLLERVEQSEIIKHVLALKLKYREVIVLYYYENLTTVQIGQLLDLPEATIRTRLKRGREQLKALICEDAREVFQID